MELLGEDLDLREERHKQPIKKNFPIKIKSSNNLICPTSNNINLVNNAQSVNKQTFFHLNTKDNPGVSLKSNETINSNQDVGYLNDFNQRNHYVSSLNWTLDIDTSSKKILDQKMDYCIICKLPILVYGRFLPCKHVICFQCASQISVKTCMRESCQENIERIEKVIAGRIFVCSYELDNTLKSHFLHQPELSQKNQCGRSYMSQRDLDAHISHRHNVNFNLME
ncbi:unnamed protein product [Brachionus calyciflorus]|uniref:E3 ubiquitin-protein ligase Hakai n=1 Tax=Brachionus calyciflorus TaxID=104777 RepID=A0A814CMM4_9BILA|nr:unnamed protein product [Brachionus calyciflorus]